LLTHPAVDMVTSRGLMRDDLTTRRRAGAIARWLGILVVLPCFALFVARRADLAKVGRTLAAADPRLVLLVAAAHLSLFLSIKAWRWRLLLAPIRRLPLGRLYAYCLAGCAVTNLLPARAGLAARVVLVRRDAVPLAGAVGSLVVEEICNAAVLGLVGAPLPFLLQLPPRVRGTLALVTAGSLLALGGLAWVALAGRARPGGRLGRLTEGVAALGHGRAAGSVVALTAAMWAADLGQIAIAMLAVGVTPSYAGVALVLLFVNLTNAFPATPGQVGLFEAGAAAACVAVGTTLEQGVAVGVVYHVVQLVPETVLGVGVLCRGALARDVYRPRPVEVTSGR
jgi:uncharacterized membrane protein YbhN (UPF0104 family)